MKIHLNTEYIRGFVEGLFAEYDTTLGPFISSLAGYGIDIKIGTIKTQVEIPFAIIGDHRADLKTSFDINKGDTIEVIKNKVEACCEEMANTVKDFEKNPHDYR